MINAFLTRYGAVIVIICVGVKQVMLRRGAIVFAKRAPVINVKRNNLNKKGSNFNVVNIVVVSERKFKSNAFDIGLLELALVRITKCWRYNRVRDTVKAFAVICFVILVVNDKPSDTIALLRLDFNGFVLNGVSISGRFFNVDVAVVGWVICVIYRDVKCFHKHGLN